MSVPAVRRTAASAVIPANVPQPSANALLELAAMTNAAKSALPVEELKKVSLRWLIKHGLGLAEAQDVFQHSLLKALTHIESLDEPGKIQSWFVGILRHTFLDLVREKKRHQTLGEAYKNEIELDQQAPELEEILCQCLGSLLEQLPELDREILTDHFIHGKSFAELSKSYDISAGTLRVKSLRARESLKGLFKSCCNIRQFEDLKECGC